MTKKNSSTDVIGAVLVFAGIAILMSLRYLSENYPQWGSLPFPAAVAMLLAGFTLWQWGDNRFRLNTGSIPPLVIVGGSLAALVLAVYLNLQICRFRLGGIELSVRWLPALLSQVIILGLGTGIFLASYPPRGGILSRARCIAAVALSLVLAVGLDFLFMENVGDLTTSMRPTRRCFPGGTCYEVGLEAWGGSGTILLLGVNLLQVLLLINALYGIFILIFKSKSRGVVR